MLLDDDPSVLAYMQTYVDRTPFLNLVAIHSAPNEALVTLDTNTIQLIFMDIDMHGMTGIEFSRMLISAANQAAPRVILISSHERYALEGYKVNALDYLLKPIAYEDFLKAAFKAKTIIEAPKNTIEIIKAAIDAPKRVYTDSDYLFLRIDYDLMKVYLKDILYFEASSNYIKIHLAVSPFLVKSLTTIKSFEDKLPTASFIRIHRSFIISIDKIESITKKSVVIGKAVIPVSDQYKSEFKTLTDQWL